MRRAVVNAGDLLEEGYLQGGFRRQAVLITLTYREVDGWRANHLTDCLKRMRQWASRRRFNLGYVWTAELQQRGAVHYHVVCWLPRGLMMPKPDKQRWWPHGSTRIERARRAVGYLVKYASKGDDVEKFPRGLRLHGRGGLDAKQRRIVAWWLLPRYVRTVFDELGTIVRRASGGGWLELCTGQWIPPWKPPEATVASG
jgi:hypothetical protein